MPEEFVVLGEQPPDEIARKLREIGDDEAARFYEEKAQAFSLEEGLFKPRKWLDTTHQYGFIPPFVPRYSRQRFRDILSASRVQADTTLIDSRVNIRLQRLHVQEYPLPVMRPVTQVVLGTNIHTILFTFEVHNQVVEGVEAVAFNQVYEAASGQDAGVTGYPIFIGLKVGSNGISLSCRTVNVGNSNDKKLVDAINSEAMKSGLSLLTTAQPGLAPFVGIAVGLATALASRSKNVGVQRFDVGLDFETGALGARLAVGSYIVAQVPRPDAIIWSEWCYDAETETIVRKNPGVEEDAYTLPHNTIIFRVSKYQN